MDKKKKKIILYILIVVVILIGVYSVLNYNSINNSNHVIKKLRHISIRNLREFIMGYGKFAAVAFLIIYSLKPIVLVFPITVLSILAGNIFGPYEAFVLSMIGCFTSATLAFFIAHRFGSKLADKILKGKAMKLDKNLDKHGFLIMLLMRLSCMFAYDPLSYAAGFTKIKYREFILGTMVGIAPEMLAYSFIGENLHHKFSIKFFIPILGIIVVAGLAYCFYNKFKNNK